MAKFKLDFNIKKFEKELDKKLNDILKKEQKRIIFAKQLEGGKVNILSKNAEDVLKIFLNKYEKEKKYMIYGSFEEFPEIFRYAIYEILEELKVKNYITKYVTSLAEWNIIISPEALEYFEKKGRRVELFQELVNDEKELLKEIIEMENADEDISDFLAKKVDNDRKNIVRGIIGKLEGNGLLKVDWASDTIYYATLTQAGRSYFEREKRYNEKNTSIVYNYNVYGNRESV